MKVKALVLLALLCDLVADAQGRTEAFAITIPEEKVSNSLYNNIRLYDIRYDTADFGIIQKGAFNRKERVVTEIPFSTQFVNVVNSLVDSTAQPGELVLLLRQLRFAEVTGAMSEKGYFHFRAALFAKEADLYKQIARWDTVVVVSALDVTKLLFRTGSKTLFEFIKSNLQKKPTEAPGFTIDQLALMDSIDKSQIPLYANRDIKDGAYREFTSFANQVPDSEVRIEYARNGSFESIQVKNKKGKFEEADLKRWYALVYQGKIYISTDYGVYPLEKKGSDFFFIGKASRPATAGEMITAGFFFGLMGMMAASSGGSGIYELKIDHISGGFIQVREAKQKEIKYY